MTKGKRRRPSIMRASLPADVLHARLLARVITRSELILGTATANEWLGAIRARKWTRVIELADALDNVEHVGVLDSYVKAQLVALVKKYPFTSSEAPGFNPEATAWKKFLAAEHRCKRVNQRQAALRNGDGFRYSDILQDMRRYIRTVLGSRPNMERIYSLCDFGPGASVGVSGNLTNLARKLLAGRWSCTRLTLPYATQALWKHDQIRHHILSRNSGASLVCYDYELFARIVAERVELVTHNNVNFVPKTFKTKRSIASEPLLNGFVQKGIDQYMRERLALRHCVPGDEQPLPVLDLSDQSLNSEMARVGSLGGVNPYVTIDLTSASDSLPISVVKLLLPPAWYDLLDRTRSHCYRYRGGIYTYHKFVSMGNGFCFPLQTVIFAAICYAVAKAHAQPVDFRVYGDDIIVRRTVAAECLEVLKHLGFRNNPDKTFIFGPFRESCGTDWYCGLDIRPVYLDYRLDSNVDLYKFHNSTLATDLTYGLFAEVREQLRVACPEEVRFVRPYHGNADSAFTVEKDVAMSSKFMAWVRSRWAWSWTELETTPLEDKLFGYDPGLCNELRYLAVLRGSSSRVPLTVRRKTKVRLRRKAYWGLPAEMSWKAADPDRGDNPADW